MECPFPSSITNTGGYPFGFLNAAACVFSLVQPQASTGSSWLPTNFSLYPPLPCKPLLPQALPFLQPICLASHCLPSHLFFTVLLSLTVETDVPTERQSPSEMVGAAESGDLPAGVVSATFERMSSSLPTKKERMKDPMGLSGGGQQSRLYSTSLPLSKLGVFSYYPPNYFVKEMGHSIPTKRFAQSHSL